MPRKIILKADPRRRGTIPRAKIRRAVEAVFGAVAPAGRKRRSSQPTARKARPILARAK